jgi:beta-lactamase class A
MVRLRGADETHHCRSLIVASVRKNPIWSLGMTIHLSRRHAFAGGLLAASTLACAGGNASAQNAGSAEARLAELERRHAGRICVSILNLGSGKRVDHRAHERMRMCSTFKAFAAALVLARVDRKQEKLDRRITYSQQDLVDWSPVTKPHAGGAGMTVAELCDATVTISDNTAGNLLLQSFGGPSGLTAFFRELGDNVSRLDRFETELNYHDHPGDERDTTTSAAMVENLRKLIFTETLSGPSRSRFTAWLVANKTGDARLRAGVPGNWLVGDKTGFNGDKVGNNNDLAVMWPPDRAPIIVSAFTEIPGISTADRNAVMAEIGRIASQV